MLNLEETSSLKNMLTFLDPKHSVILSDEIGLLGNYWEEYVQDDVAYEKDVDAKVADVYAGYSFNKVRGDYFTVIDKDGVILFDYDVKMSGIIIDKQGLIGYCFVLKDFTAKDFFNELFDTPEIKPAVVIYKDNKLYINDVEDEKLQKQFIVDKSIELIDLGTRQYKLMLNGSVYSSVILDYNNKVYKFTNIKIL